MLRLSERIVINLFYLVVGIGFVFSLIVQGWLRTTYAKWSKVRNSMNLPGANVARHMLDKNGLGNSPVTMQAGNLTDHYDPRTKTVSLSQRISVNPALPARRSRPMKPDMHFRTWKDMGRCACGVRSCRSLNSGLSTVPTRSREAGFSDRRT